MRKTFKYRLYPSKKQFSALELNLSEARFLYNSALRERKDAWSLNRKSLSYFDQANQLKEIRKENLLHLANFSACQDVLRRVDKTFKSFFFRTKKGQKAGFPRFKGQNRFDSFTYPSYGDGCKLKPNNKVYLQGIGDVKVKLHREIAGKIKTVSVIRESAKWFVCFSVESEKEILPKTGQVVGIDVGIENFVTLSDGTQIDNWKYYESSQKELRRAQRSVARKKKGSNNRRKAVLKLRQIHNRIKNRRADFQHKLSTMLVRDFDIIAIEKLNILGMSKGILAKQIHDTAWSSFFNMLDYKAENAGRQLIKVNPNGTSQTCICGQRVEKSLAQRQHTCLKCGYSNHRDIVSAEIILSLGLSDLDLTKAVGL